MIHEAALMAIGFGLANIVENAGKSKGWTIYSIVYTVAMIIMAFYTS